MPTVCVFVWSKPEGSTVVDVNLAWPVSRSVNVPESAVGCVAVTPGFGLSAGEVCVRVPYEVYWRVAGSYQERTKLSEIEPGVVLPRRSSGWSRSSVRLTSITGLRSVPIVIEFTLIFRPGRMNATSDAVRYASTWLDA